VPALRFGTPWPLLARERELAELRRALARRISRGVVIAGPPGVGASRMAEECLAGDADWRVTATTAATTPLGAIAHLIPAGMGSAKPDAVIRAMRDSATGVVLVDDAHNLDPASATVLRGLLDHGALRLIATVRTGEPCHPDVAALLADARLYRADLAPFGRDAVGEVLCAALGGPVASRTVSRLFDASGGIVRYLRELVPAALANGALAWDGELWRLAVRPLPRTPALTELITARLAVAPAAARPVLELLALCAPVSVRDAEQVAGPEVLAEVVAAGLVRLDRESAGLAHPLYAEVARDRMSVLRRHLVLNQHVERVDGHTDALRLATWQLAATGTADAELLSRAATLALRAGEYQRAVELIEAIPVDRRPLVPWGVALSQLGRWHEADEVLRRDRSAAASSARAWNLFAATGDIDGALRTPGDAEWLIAARTTALALTGRTNEAIERAFQTTTETQWVPVILALADAGQFDRARSIAKKVLAAVTSPSDWTWAATFLGRVEWLAGDLLTARHWYAEAIAEAEPHHQIRPLAAACAGVAATAAALGDLPAAQAALAKWHRFRPAGMDTGEESLGEAWLAAARGDLARARAVLVDAAASARNSGYRAVELTVLTELARLGGAAQAANRVAELARLCPSPLAAARSRLVQALAANESGPLDAVARDLAELGAYLLAAEAGCAAATAWTKAGLPSRADTAARHARDWATRCPGATTPGLATTAVLTTREREIALRAAAGDASKTIAAALGLSRRTVENHLGRVYTKIGVRSRQELALAMRGQAVALSRSASALASSWRVPTPSLA
jgi:DNA-binding CsgD family transcriptional regulator